MLAQENQISRTGIILGRVLTPTEGVADDILRGKKLLRYDTHHHAAEPVKPFRLSEVAVVYLEGLKEKIPFSPPETRPVLNQYQIVFRPLVLPVQAGTTVDFPNSDNLFHNVFSYSQPKEFDLGRYPLGEQKSVRFDKPGIVNVYCDIHSYMYATILVFDHPYFTIPDDDGNFSLTGVPEGRYDISFWYGRKRVETRKITVKSDETVYINFP